MSDDKPIWLLDVDGVLNCFDPNSAVLKDWGDWEQFIAHGFPMHYSPAMVARIRALHTSGAVEVRWLTTWGGLANSDLKAHLGLPELVVAAEQPYLKNYGWWKLPVAQNLFSAGHRLIWTDDDMPTSDATTKWLHRVANSRRASDLLAIAPQGAISEQEMDSIEQWIENK